MSIQHQGTAVVTGASAGIGAAYAKRLARRGYDLILIARNRDRLDALASQISNETGRGVEVVVADLNNQLELAHIETLLKTDASITLLVNNAGVGAVSPLLQSNVDQMQAMIELNVTALTRLTYAVVPALVARGKGTIINIASVVAVGPEILNGVYGGTKAFVLAFSQSLHHELADKGIRVQAVLPGATSTDLWATAGLPIEHLPQEIVMPVDEMVDAALAGFDQGEFATIPSLPNVADWNAFDTARKALQPNLSHKHAATRYKSS